ncbi:MAG TPA: hypothetical protein VJR89_28890 [Polyangiales bacterium]|nr:hypothetical protein [Polyangiales bacterium]
MSNPLGFRENWTIRADGIGNLRLGEALPEPEVGFEDTYRTSFYGDWQPLEGFMFSDPPVLAVFTDGPFTSWGERHAGRSAPEAIETRAIALARAHRFKVHMLVTTDSRPKTAAGISVGDDYAKFAQAYPRAPAPEPFRGLWEQPSCMVSRETIWFFFDRCDNADEAKIIRIAVRPDGSRV